MKEINIPTVGQKVKIGNNYGTVTNVYPPNEKEGFSGRFRVDLHMKNMILNKEEFWWSDWNTSVIPVEK